MKETLPCKRVNTLIQTETKTRLLRSVFLFDQQMASLCFSPSNCKVNVCDACNAELTRRRGGSTRSDKIVIVWKKLSVISFSVNEYSKLLCPLFYYCFVLFLPLFAWFQKFYLFLSSILKLAPESGVFDYRNISSCSTLSKHLRKKPQTFKNKTMNYSNNIGVVLTNSFTCFPGGV